MARPGGTRNGAAVPELGQRVEAKLIAVAGLPSGQHQHQCVHRRGCSGWRIGWAVYETGGDLGCFPYFSVSMQVKTLSFTGQPLLRGTVFYRKLSQTVFSGIVSYRRDTQQLRKAGF